MTSPAEAESRYRSWDEHWQRHGFGYWVIRSHADRDAPEPLGFCGIKVMELHGRTAPRTLTPAARMDST